MIHHQMILMVTRNLLSDPRTTSSGSGSDKVYTGYTATFTGVTDGACFNQVNAQPKTVLGINS